jgi:formate-dependent nitrite reductase membrane component NrfD
VIYLLNLLLFLLPFLAYAIWRRYNPQAEPDPRIVVLGLIGIGLGLAAATWYGLSVSMDRDTVYIPAYLDEHGRIVPGRAEPRR